MGYLSVVDDSAMENKINDGDVWMLDTGAKWDNYWSDFDRNFIMGPKDPPQAVLDAHEALWVCTEEALNKIKPGITFGDVW